MRHLNGIHFPNVAFGDSDQLLKAVGPLGAVTLLQSELGWYDTLRHQAPERLIHVRFYHPNWTQLQPAAWVDTAVKALGRLLDDPFVAVSFANEQNLGSEAGDPDVGHQYKFQSVVWYEKIAAWNLECAAWFAKVPHKCLTVSSALADGHEPDGFPPDGEYTIPGIRQMLAAFDLIGIHPYALLHQNAQSGATGRDAAWYMLRPFRRKGYKDATDPGGVVSQYPTRSFLVSETGTFTHSDVARTDETWRELTAFYRACQESGRVVGVTPFIWATDKAHPQNNMQPNSELKRRLAEMPRYETTATLRSVTLPPIEVPPMPDTFTIGQGFRDAMQTLGTKPTMNEQNPTAGFPYAWIYDDAGNYFVYRQGMGVRVHLSQTITPSPVSPPPVSPPTSAAVELDGMPLWNQLDDGNTDADGTDENKYSNCLAETIAMIVYRTYGYEEYADSVKDEMAGDAYLGNLFVRKADWHSDGMRYLMKRANIPVKVYDDTQPHDIQAIIQTALAQDFPVCVLYRYPAGAGGALVNHFSAAYACDSNGVTLANPWGGRSDTYTWQAFKAVYLNWAIVCQRPRDPFLRQTTARVLDDTLTGPDGGEAGTAPLSNTPADNKD